MKLCFILIMKLVKTFSYETWRISGRSGFIVSSFSSLVISSVLIFFSSFHSILVPPQFSWVIASLNKTLYYYLRATLGSLPLLAKNSLQVQRWFLKIQFSVVLWFPEKHTAKFLPVYTYYRIIVSLFLRPWGRFMNLIFGQVCFHKVSCSTLNQT